MLSNITFKHRLIGAIFLVSLAVIIVPALFDTPRVDSLSSAQSPEAPLQTAWEELDKIEYTFSELPEVEIVGQIPAESAVVVHETMAEPTPEIVAEASPEIVNMSAEHGSTSAPAPAPMPAPKPELTPIKPSVMAESSQPAHIQIPASVPAEPAVIAATEKLIQSEGWAVQLGAFSKIENATALAKRLEEKGYDVFLEEMTSAKLTRVLVGTQSNKQQANDLLTELDKNLQLKGIVVKYNPKG